MMKKTFTPSQFKKNNFANNHITVECMFSADFKNQTEEHFKKCLEQVPKVNRLLIDKSKCDNEEHYNRILCLADTLFTMTLLEKRLLN